MTQQINLFRFAQNVETYKAGDTIFREGDTGSVMYVVQEGTVNLEINGQVIEQLGAGSLFGEMALIDQTTRGGNAIAATDVKIVPIDQKRFIFLVDETPNFALTVMRIMSDRLRQANARWAPPAPATPAE